MKIHREGKKLIIGFALMALSLAISFFILFSLLVFFILSASILVFMVLVIRFFRVPEREVLVSETHVVAPADGIVVAIEKVMEKEYFNTEMVQVSIFMSIHDMHKNFYPLSGKVIHAKYHPGKYLVARHPKSSSLNERTSVVITNDHATIMVRQVAGFVARRIICNATEGSQVTQAQELGFIKFGSRLDLFLPPDARIRVSIGERTFAGQTVISDF